MSQLFKSGFCISKSADHSLDSEEYIKKGNNLLNWKIPKVPKNQIYKKSNKFALSSDRSIKTIEGQVSFGHGNGGVKLINENTVMNVFRDERFYTTFNVGMIQIGVKSLTRKIPTNASIILCVRDTRHEKFEDSIMGMVESKLSDGPFYFNVFPNITMSAYAPKLSQALVVHVLVDGFEHLPPGSEPITVFFRTIYKLQNGSEPTALIESPDGKTVFFQTDVEGSNVAVQNVTNWDAVVSKFLSSIAAEKAS